MSRDGKDFGFLYLEIKISTKDDAVSIRKYAFIFQKTCQIEVRERGESPRSRGRAFRSWRVCQEMSRACPVYPDGGSFPLATGWFGFFTAYSVSESKRTGKNF